MPKKGYKQTKEHIEKMIKSKTGKKLPKFTDEHKQKISLSSIGKKMSSQAKSRMSEAKKGKKLTDEHKRNIGIGNKGHECYEATKLKIGLANKGNKYGLGNKSLLGRKLTDEHKRNIGIGNKGKNLGNSHTEESIEKIRVARANQAPIKKDTIPEKMMQLSLQLEKIPFEKHKKLLGQPDIFIEPNICLFIDGCYWHDCNQCGFSKRNQIFRDTVVNHKLTLDGYIIIRIWSHDIIKSGSKNQKNIISTIKQLRLIEP
jgi:G:T-mismatch repair DNA endonuclease (very short patch repair protein)